MKERKLFRTLAVLTAGTLGITSCNGGESASSDSMSGSHYTITKGSGQNELIIHASDGGGLSLGDAKTGSEAAVNRINQTCGPITGLEKIEANYGNRTMDIFVRVPDSAKCFPKK